MRDPFQTYDAWKTASPFDDEIDPIEDADRFIKATNKYADDPKTEEQRLIVWARTLVEELARIVDDGG